MIEPSPGEPASIAALFSRLIDDAERFVRAEVRLYRAQALARLTDAKAAILMGGIAFLLVQSAIIAMLVGLVLILRRPLGAVGATLVVVVVALAVAALLGRLAFSRIKKMTEIKEGPE
jgi:hypothetical protein